MMRFHPIRAVVLRVLLTELDTEWTVSALTEAAGLDETAQIFVRELVLTLMNERLMEPVPYQRALTVRLRTGAETAVRLLLNGWRSQAARNPQPTPASTVETATIA